ncbi:MAG: TetR/AcrR family transcriptional regulator [Thiolinea sp.]
MPVVRKSGNEKKQKRELKKQELLRDAIATLSALGYARTSLRDIAKHSGVSVGVIHYYFEDKEDLIEHCVSIYKQEFIEKLQQVTSSSQTCEELIDGFLDGLALAIRQNAEYHRLWYDIRSQAMFDPHFHAMTNEIETALVRLVDNFMNRACKLANMPPSLDNLSFYLMLDGQFRYWLQQKLCAGVDDAPLKLKHALRANFAFLTKGL